MRRVFEVQEGKNHRGVRHQTCQEVRYLRSVQVRSDAGLPLLCPRLLPAAATLPADTCRATRIPCTPSAVPDIRSCSSIYLLGRPDLSHPSVSPYYRVRRGMSHRSKLSVNSWPLLVISRVVDYVCALDCDSQVTNSPASRDDQRPRRQVLLHSYTVRYLPEHHIELTANWHIEIRKHPEL